MMEYEENQFQQDEANNVEMTEVRLSPLQVLLKVEQEGGQLHPPHLHTLSIWSVLCHEKLGFELIETSLVNDIELVVCLGKE